MDIIEKCFFCKTFPPTGEMFGKKCCGFCKMRIEMSEQFAKLNLEIYSGFKKLEEEIF